MQTKDKIQLIPKPLLYTLLQLVFYIFGCFSITITSTKASFAQLTPDNTLDTQVDGNGQTDRITGGQTRGDNLFHSFQDFSVRAGSEAFFDNANNISNIFSRVTGGNISQIEGLIRTNGDASLFLINPNGIVFGESARLNLGGSFLSSTASSILFDEGEFSAVDLDNSLLTINAPIGLGLEDNPGEIVNRSTVQNSNGTAIGLEVLAGNNLSFVGGNIRFDGGQAVAPGAKIELGGRSTAGTVDISEDGSLSFPENVAKADLTLVNGATVNVRGVGGGEIVINASNLSLRESNLIAGIAAESTSANVRAGNIEINLSDRLSLDNSNITNVVEAEGVGNSGDIDITTGTLRAINRGQIDTNTFGKGNGGNINITATGDLTFDGENDNLESGVNSLVIPGAEGDAGDIAISTQGNLTLTNGGRIDVSSNGRGNAGNVAIVARSITIDGEDLEELGSGIVSLINPEAEGNSGNITISTQDDLTLINRGRVEANNNSNGRGNGGNVTIDIGGNLIIDGAKNSKGFGSNIRSLVNENATGDSGNIAIATGGNLTLNNQAEVDSSSNGRGNSGNIAIATGGNLSLNNQSRVDAANSGEGDSGNITISTAGNLTSRMGGQIDANINNTQGNAGDIIIDALGDITFEGDDANGDGSGATSLVGADGSGNAGNITISTDGKLTLLDGGRIDVSSNRGEGSAGAIAIRAADNITFEGEDSRGFGSGATSQVNPGVERGNSGGITIFTQGNLLLKDGGRVDTSTNARGDAGSIEITALGDITFIGRALNGNASGATSQVNPEAAGNAGGVTISTGGNLTLKDGGRVDVAINAMEDGENIASINGDRPLTANNANIDLQVAENIFLDDNALISARAAGNSDGGNLKIDTEFIVAVPNSNSDIIASAEQGRGGNITVNARSIFGIEERPLSDLTNDLNASSEFGLSGIVEIEVLDVDLSGDKIQSVSPPIGTQVVRVCDPEDALGQNSFLVSGRNSLQNFSKAALAGNLGWEDWQIGQLNGESSNSSIDLLPTKSEASKIVEAQNWIVNDAGKVELVAKTATTLPKFWSNSSCLQDT